MPTTPLLGIQELTPSQTGKETTINNAILALEAATNATLAVSMAGGNVTLSVAQFTNNFIFHVSGLTANRILSIPALVNATNTTRIFSVRNTSVHDVQVSVTGSSGTFVTVPAGQTHLLDVDGAGDVNFVAAPSIIINTEAGSITVTTDATANHNVVLADANTYLEMTDAAANTVTIQSHATEAIPVGARVLVQQNGAGQTTFVAGAGVTIHSPGTLALRAQYSTVIATQVATDIWVLFGDLVGVGATSIDQLNDVDTSSVAPTDGQALVWNNGVTQWKPFTISASSLGLKRLIPFFFTSAPNSAEVLAIYACTDIFTIPASLAGTQVVMLASGSPPAADFAIDVRHNNASIGTITIHSTGLVTLAGAGVTTAIGDTISVHAPAGISAAILNWAFNIVGVF